MREREIKKLRIVCDDTWDIVYWITDKNQTYIMYAQKDDTKSKIKIL